MGFSKIAVMCAVFVFSFAGLACAHGHHGHKEKEPKTGILLVSFGTSVSEAEKAMENIEAETKKRFSGIPVKWAYTSGIIRHKLSERGEDIASPAQALADMLEEGFNRIAVQSLHVIPGEEYFALLQEVEAFREIAPDARISLGHPLMYSHQDMQKVAGAVMDASKPYLQKGRAVVLMGHGTHHAGNIYYPGLQDYISRRSNSVLVGTVEGAPTLKQVMSDLKTAQEKKVCLMPLMSVAGDHARNDMAGPEDESWKSRMRAEGFDTTSLLKGLGEDDRFVALWLDHLKNALHEVEHH